MTLYEVIFQYINAFFPNGIDYFDEVLINIFVHILVYFIAFSLMFALFKLLKSIFLGFRK